jgi:hypothetical protein
MKFRVTPLSGLYSKIFIVSLSATQSFVQAYVLRRMKPCGAAESLGLITVLTEPKSGLLCTGQEWMGRDPRQAYSPMES